MPSHTEMAYAGEYLVDTHEAERLAALARLGRHHLLPELAFDRVAVAAAAVAGVPTAIVSLIDGERLWYKGAVGVDHCSYDRQSSLCNAVISGDVEIVVPDAGRDERFARLPPVAGEPHVRLYAGFPVRTSDGHAVGVLCVMGDRPGVLDAGQLTALRALAAQTGAHLELHATLAERWGAAEAHAGPVDGLVDTEARWRELVDFSTDVVMSELDTSGATRSVSASLATVLGYEPQEGDGADLALKVHPADEGRYAVALDAARRGESALVTVRAWHRGGSWRTLDVRLTPRVEAGGVVSGIFSAARDVTTGDTSDGAGGWQYLTVSKALGGSGWSTSDPSIDTIVPVAGAGPELAQVLGVVGDAGWELVTSAGDQLICKRPRQSAGGGLLRRSVTPLATAVAAPTARPDERPAPAEVDAPTLTRLWSHLANLDLTQ